MATPPTFVAAYQSVFNTTTTPKTTGTFNASTGDVLVSAVPDANDNNSENYSWSNTGGSVGTWTELTESSGTLNNDIWLQGAYLIPSGAITTGAVSATRVAGSASDWFGVVVGHFTGSAGIGATAQQAGNGTTTGSLNITTTGDNSAIFCMFADWAALSGARTWRTVNGITPTVGNGLVVVDSPLTQYSVYAAYYNDAGAAGVKTVGLSAPSGGDYIGVAFEILGTTTATSSDVAAPWLLMPPGRISPASRLWVPAQGVADSPIAVTATASITLSASGNAAADTTGTGSITLSASGTATAPVTGTGSLTLGASGTAQAATTGTGSLTLSGSGTATAPTTGGGSITFGASGTTTSPTTGTGSITFSATGTAGGGGVTSGTGSIDLAASGTATAPTTGTGSLSLSASGNAAAPVTGTGSLTFSASGNVGVGVTGTGTLTLAASGTARAVVISTASLSLAAAAQIAATAGGTASIVFAATGNATGPTTTDPYPMTATFVEAATASFVERATFTFVEGSTATDREQATASFTEHATATALQGSH